MSDMINDVHGTVSLFGLFNSNGVASQISFLVRADQHKHVTGREM